MPSWQPHYITSGRTWLVTKAGMERLYGKEKKARSKGSNRVAVGSNRVAMNLIFAESYRAYSR